MAWLLKHFGQKADMALQAEIFMVSRLYRREGLQRFLDAVHKLGGLAVFDTDDDLTEEFRQLDGRGDEFTYTVSQMDAITVSTPYLKKRMEQHTDKSVHVLPNHIDVNWFKRVSLSAERLIDTVTVGVLGTSSHYGDWHYPVEALRRLKEEMEGELTVLTGGFAPDYLQDLALSIQVVPYSQYPAMVSQFDIIACVLNPDDPFNLSKSGVKALEAMAAARHINGALGGAVPVCTDMPVYRRVINNGKNGYLVENDDWYDTLKALVTDQALRKRVAVQGLRWVTKNRDIRTGWRRWSRVYRSLCKE
jgi:glycosyltransferase involved in cell wall biosynthesis